MGKRVEYRIGTPAARQAYELVTALKSVFRSHPAPAHFVFRRVTAFTHARRIEIYRGLKQHPHTLVELHAATRISMPALFRHLGKLQARDFVTCRRGFYAAKVPAEPLGRALARLAAEA